MPRKRKKQPVQTPTGMPYGQGEKLADAQRQLPIPNAPTIPSPSSSTAGRQQAATPAPPAVDPIAAAITAAAQVAPPSGAFAAETSRPDEPLTAGLPVGAGPGTAALGLPAIPEDDDTLNALVVAYQRTGSQSLARLIEIVRNRTMDRRRTLDRGYTYLRGR